MSSRINTAVEFLKEGKSFRVGDLRLGIDETGDIEVAGWSQFVNFDSITKETCIKELKEIKALFGEMIEDSPEAVTFFQNKAVIYALYFDDYGKASISLCSEKEGVIKWHLRSLG